jgi:hypothetical protein
MFQVDAPPTIEQLGELLKIASNENFLPPIIELYKKNEAYRILESIYPNNSTDEYDYLLESVKKILHNNDDDILSWILILESEMDTENVQNFLLEVSSPLITSNFENLLNDFVRNRIGTFTESILSMRFEPGTNVQSETNIQSGTNVQPGTNVQLLSQDKINFYKPIIEHILSFFNYDPYITKVGSLPVVSSSKQNFDLYIENIYQLIQQDKDSFFSGLFTYINNWSLRERLKEILQMNESDIDTIVDSLINSKVFSFKYSFTG